MGLTVDDRIDVLVVGAGPVGLTMAAELARHGVRSRICDRLPEPSPYCRAIGVTPRTLEVWDDMGIAHAMIDAGIWIDAQRDIINGQIKDTIRDLSDLPYASLGIPQYETERLLTTHLAKFGIHIERGIALENLSQRDGQVTAKLIGPTGQREEATFRYVIGCDGAHSAVRRALGIAFEGSAIPAGFMLGDVHIDWTVPRGTVVRALRPVADGIPEMFIAVPLPESGRYRVTSVVAPELTAPSTGAGSEHGIQSERPAPGIHHLQEIADKMLPEQAILSDLRWSSIFRISMRLAANYRIGNAFIAGDAAHIHPPTGGQGMNTGIQDAYNLAWKLALVLKGQSPEALLDSYEAERRAVGQDVVARTTQASVDLGRQGRAQDNRLADTQLLISYRDSAWVSQSETQFTDPAPGDRLPDCHGLRRHGFGFPLRLFDILRGIDHVLIAYLPNADPSAKLNNLAAYAHALASSKNIRLVAIIPSASRIKPPNVSVYTDAEGEFQKIIGPQPTTLLVRPDGHIAWRGESLCDADLAAQLKRTFTDC